MTTDVNEVPEFEGAYEAEVHVHFRDEDVDVVICRANVSFVAEIGHAEVETLVMGLRNQIEGFMIECGEAWLHLVSGVAPPPSSGTVVEAHPNRYVAFGLSLNHDSNILWAVVERERLIDLLMRGCASDSRPQTASQPPPKCN